MPTTAPWLRSDLHAAVVEISRRAGSEILDVYGTDFTADSKADASPITQADLREIKLSAVEALAVGNFDSRHYPYLRFAIGTADMDMHRLTRISLVGIEEKRQASQSQDNRHRKLPISMAVWRFALSDQSERIDQSAYGRRVQEPG